MNTPACPLRFTHCRCCGQAFSEFNTFSEAGWIETQVSRLCEVCFDVVSDLPRKDADDTEAPG
jgi:hypothetical protein